MMPDKISQPGSYLKNKGKRIKIDKHNLLKETVCKLLFERASLFSCKYLAND